MLPDRNIEWVMATASDTKGWLPMWVRKLSFLSNTFLIRISFYVARRVLGVEELPGLVSLLQFYSDKDVLTPKSFREVGCSFRCCQGCWAIHWLGRDAKTHVSPKSPIHGGEGEWHR